MLVRPIVIVVALVLPKDKVPADDVSTKTPVGNKRLPLTKVVSVPSSEKRELIKRLVSAESNFARRLPVGEPEVNAPVLVTLDQVNLLLPPVVKT